MRKGIYNIFHPSGNMIGDERWQIVRGADGSLQLDNETVRLKPFDEPRSDSITYMLDANLQPLQFSIHGLFGHREGRVSWTEGKAFSCWQHGLQTHRREYEWSVNGELDYFSPLFNVVAILRGKLQPGQTRKFDCLYLDPITFAPSMMWQSYKNCGIEPHPTRFGEMNLTRYEMNFGDRGMTQMWADDSGILFDFVSDSGYQIKLVAVNFE